MTRLTTEQIVNWSLRAGAQLKEGNDHELTAILEELFERRRADIDLSRLANVLHGYYERNGEYPLGGTRDLLAHIDKMLEANER